MRLTILILVISVAAIAAQRRPNKLEAYETDSLETSSVKPPQRAITRGRARFVKTPDFEKVADDYEKAKEPKKRVESSRRTKLQHNIDRRYEVNENVDDIPDVRKYTKPAKVITETKFEAVNAPTRTKLFEPVPTEPAKIEDLIKDFGSIERGPTKVELPQLLNTDVSPSSSTSTTEKESVSSTEKQISEEAAKEIQKDSAPSTTSTTQASTTANGRRTIGRSRGRTSADSKNSSTNEVSTQRTRTRTRTRTEATAESSSTSAPHAGRAQFRTGRRRVSHEQESLRGRGPSIIENHDEQPARARSERRVLTSSRRRESDTTSTTSTENSRSARIEAARRSRTRPQAESQPQQQPQRNNAETNVRRRTPARVEETTTQKSEATTRKQEARVSRGRTKSRFNPTEELFRVDEEPKQPRAVTRSRGRTRGSNLEELVASSTVENPIRSLPDSSTVRTVTISRRSHTPESPNGIKTEGKQRVKETIMSEVSEVVSTRKVTRRKKVEATTKPIPVSTTTATRKPHVSVKVDEPRITVSQVITRGSKKSEAKNVNDDEDLDELNYPPQFKALILAKNKPKVKKGSRPELNSVTGKSTTVFVQERVVQSVGSSVAPTTPIVVSSTVNIITPSSTTAATTTHLPSTTSTSSSSTTHASSTGTASLTLSLNVEDSDNELVPKISTRLPRRRFSVSTKPPQKKGSFTTSKAKPTLPSRKTVVRSTTFTPEVRFEESTTQKLKFHARFSLGDVTKGPEVEKTTASPTVKRTYPSKPSRVPYTRKPVKHFEERKVTRGGKVYESAAVPAQVVPLSIGKKSNRYSSRYRSDPRPGSPLRSSTVVPAYLPTVPTVTPTNQVPPGVHTEDNGNYQIISIDDPVNTNSLFSDNLISDNSTNTTTVQQNDDNKPVSIIERIINSITSISTSTAKPEDNEVKPTGSSAILRIASKKPKSVETTTAKAEVTTEKPTTIIERILSSLSAIQASDHVGSSTHPTAPAKSSSLAPSNTPNPLGASTFGDLLNLLHTNKQFADSTKTVNKYSTPKVAAYTASPLDNEILYTSPIPKVSKQPSTAPRSTVAISLADYLASLGIADRVKTTTGRARSLTSASLVTTLPTTTVGSTATTQSGNTIIMTDSTTVVLSTMGQTSTTVAEMSTNMVDAGTTPANQMDTTTIGQMSTMQTTDAPQMSTRISVTTDMPEMTTIVTPSPMSTTTAEATTLIMPESTTDVGSTFAPTVNSNDSPTKITIDITTPEDTTQTTEPFKVSLNSVTVISPDNNNNKNNHDDAIVISSRSQPITTNQSNRSGKLLTGPIPDISNNDINPPSSTTPRARDYFVFAVLPNNTIVRKRPPMVNTAPYLIVGVYPNNTIVQKYPNGTLVPEEPVVQVSGFDTRDPLPTSPPPPVITTRVSEQGMDDARDTKNVVDVEANLLSLDNNDATTTTTITTTNNPTTSISSTTTIPSTTTISTTTVTNMNNTDNNTNLSTLTELLGGKIAEDFKNIVNQTVESGNANSNDGSLAQQRDKENEINSVVTTSSSTTTVMTEPPTTIPPTTTTVLPTTTTTLSPTTMTSAPAMTTFTTSAPFTTTDLTSFIASFLSTLRPVYTPTTTRSTVITTDVPTTLQETTTTTTTTTTQTPTTLSARTVANSVETTYQPTVTITARPRTPTIRYTTTPTSITTTSRIARRTTTIAPTTMTNPPVIRRRTTTLAPTTTELPSTTRAPTTTRAPVSTTTRPPTTITIPPSTTPLITTFITSPPESRTTINPANVDIDELLKKSNKKLSEEQLKELEAIRELEREQKALLEQLSFLTNLNIGGQTTNAPQKPNGNGLANRILAFAMDRNKEATTLKSQNPTTTEPGITIVQAIPSVAARQPKKVVLDDKGTTLDDILKELNSNNGNSIDPTLATYGKSQDAIIAAILKERGIQPPTPKSLGDQIRQNNLFDDQPTTIRATTTTTTRRPRTTTQRAPGRLIQGLNWLLNAIAPPPTTFPATQRPRPRPKPTTTTTTVPTTFVSTDFNEIFGPTETLTTFQTTRSPRRPGNSLSDDELQNLIAQLEAIQKDPKQARNLDLSSLKGLQRNTGGRTLDKKNVEITSSGTSGSNRVVTRAPKLPEDEVPLVTNRGRQVKSTTISPVSVSNSIDDDEVVTNPRFRVTTQRAQTTRARATLPPVQLNPVPGVNDDSGPMIGGQFLNAAVNVTRAISTFLGSAIQGAAQSFQSMIGSGSRGVGSYFSASSPRQG